MVDRVREDVELVPRAALGESVIEARGPQSAGRAQDVAHRARGLHGEQVADERREQRHQHAHRHQQPHQAGHALIEHARVHAHAQVVADPPRLSDPLAHVPVGADVGDELPAVEPARGMVGDRVGTIVTLPDGLPIVRQQVHEPAARLMAGRHPPHLVDHPVDVGMVVAQRRHDLDDGGPQHAVGLAVEHGPGSDAHDEERRQRGHEHDRRVPEREPDAEARPPRPVTPPPAHSHGPGRCG